MLKVGDVISIERVWMPDRIDSIRFPTAGPIIDIKSTHIGKGADIQVMLLDDETQKVELRNIPRWRFDKANSGDHLKF